MQTDNNQMTDELVSVVVNVFNCKEYLPISLESVRQQSYNNLEVILVDDASTDGSGEFCDEYAKHDPRFRVIHHEKNTGVSRPRNTGLREAKGEYIYFMDSDDYIHERAIELLVWAIQETGLELAVFDLKRTGSLTEDTRRKLHSIEPQKISSEQMIFEMLSRVDTRWCVVWNKLYKKTLLDGLSFNDYYSIQDQDFNIRVYKKIEQAAFVPEVLYWYYQSPNSLQRNKSLYPKKFYYNTIYRFRMLDYLSKDGKDKKYRAWVIDYGYRQILDRREIVKGSDYEKPFATDINCIIKNTFWEFLASREITIKRRLRFPFYWYCQKLSDVYVRIVYGKE